MLVLPTKAKHKNIVKLPSRVRRQFDDAQQQECAKKLGSITAQHTQCIRATKSNDRLFRKSQHETQTNVWHYLPVIGYTDFQSHLI